MSSLQRREDDYSSSNRANIFGGLILLMVAAVWGATLSFSKELLPVLPLQPFLAFRFAVAALTLVAALPFVKREKISFLNTGGAVLLGVLLYSIFYFQTLGLKTTSTAATGFITGTNVVMVPLITVVLFRTKISARVWFGILLAVVGLGFVAGVNLFGPLSGAWSVLFSAFLIAVDIVAIERFMGFSDPIWLAFVEISTAGLVALLFALMGGDLTHVTSHVLLSPMVVFALVFNGVLGTAIALLAQNYFQTLVPSAQVAIIFSTEPIFAAVFAWWFFRGQVTLAVIFGGALVLCGVLIADEEVFGLLDSKFVAIIRESHTK